MNINEQYAWQSAEDCRENNRLLPRNLRGLVIGNSGCGKTTLVFNILLQPGWLDYIHLHVLGKSLHRQDSIEKFSGVRNRKVRADFYDDCQDIPDPSALDPTQ